MHETVLHIQNVNAYGGRFKQWLVRFNGVATKYLQSYLGWRALAGKGGGRHYPANRPGSRRSVEAYAQLRQSHQIKVNAGLSYIFISTSTQSAVSSTLVLSSAGSQLGSFLRLVFPIVSSSPDVLPSPKAIMTMRTAGQLTVATASAIVSCAGSSLSFVAFFIGQKTIGLGWPSERALRFGVHRRDHVPLSPSLVVTKPDRGRGGSRKLLTRDARSRTPQRAI